MRGHDSDPLSTTKKGAIPKLEEKQLKGTKEIVKEAMKEKKSHERRVVPCDSFNRAYEGNKKRKLDPPTDIYNKKCSIGMKRLEESRKEDTKEEKYHHRRRRVHLSDSSDSTHESSKRRKLEPPDNTKNKQKRIYIVNLKTGKMRIKEPMDAKKHFNMNVNAVWNQFAEDVRQRCKDLETSALRDKPSLVGQNARPVTAGTKVSDAMRSIGISSHLEIKKGDLKEPVLKKSEASNPSGAEGQVLQPNLAVIVKPVKVRQPPMVKRQLVFLPDYVPEPSEQPFVSGQNVKRAATGASKSNPNSRLRRIGSGSQVHNPKKQYSEPNRLLKGVVEKSRMQKQKGLQPVTTTSKASLMGRGMEVGKAGPARAQLNSRVKNGSIRDTRSQFQGRNCIELQEHKAPEQPVITEKQPCILNQNMESTVAETKSSCSGRIKVMGSQPRMPDCLAKPEAQKNLRLAEAKIDGSKLDSISNSSSGKLVEEIERLIMTYSDDEVTQKYKSPKPPMIFTEKPCTSDQKSCSESDGGSSSNGDTSCNNRFEMASQYVELMTRWNLPPLEAHISDADDEEWLFRTKLKQQQQ